MTTANAIRIKRRKHNDPNGAGAPNALQWGELAYNEVDNILYYGYGSGTNGEDGIVNSTSVYPIAGSGKYVDRLSDQEISGDKTFLDNVNISGQLTVANITFNQSTVTLTNMTASSGGFGTLSASGLDIIAPNTSNESVGYFAVFDSNPDSTAIRLKSVSKDVILDDIGAAASGLDITAGSGLQGGGALSGNITFDIGQGDGISISANDVSVDDTVVRTSGNQSISGVKIFMHDAPIFSGGISSIAAHTSSSNVEYFAVFETDPASLAQTLKSVSKSDVLDDIGGASSGLTLTAGSGLQGGGTLSENRTLDIITGYGIDISNDAVVVDTVEVVVTTGTQSVSGVKTFANNIVFQSGFIGSGVSTLQAAASAVNGTYFPVFTGSPVSESQNVVSRTASEVKSDIGLSNVTNHSQIKKTANTTVGYVPTWSVITGDELGTGYAVETSTLTGDSSSLARADVIKNYVDSAIIAGFAANDAMMFKGALDCSADPLYPSGDAGHTYKVSVAGKIGGGSGPVVELNDTLICSVDASPSGDHATVGGNWVILQTNIVDKDILVAGPSTATDGGLAIYDGTTGKLLEDSGISIYNVVLTTGNQNISGIKVFHDDSAEFIPVSGAGGGLWHSYFRGMEGDYTPFQVVYDNTDNYGSFYLRSYNGTTQSTVLSSVSGVNVLNASQVNSDLLSIKATNLGATASHFAAFNVDPNTTKRTIYSRPAANIKGDIGLGNVENTQLSTWVGSTYITTLGTIATGTWNADTIAVNKGGTGQTSYANGELLIGSGTSLVKNTLSGGDGISVTNGSGTITIATDNYVVKTTGAQTINGLKTFGEKVTITGSPFITSNILYGNIILDNSSANIVRFNGSGVSGPPTNATIVSGTKLILRPDNGTQNAPYVSLGLNSFAWWHSVPTASWDYEWYAGGSKIATLFGDGTFNTTNISGTNFYLNGTRINSTAAQLNLLSGGSDGQILYNNNGSFGVSHFTTPLFAYLTSPDSSINIVYNGDQAVRITHADTSAVTSTSYSSGTVIGNLTVDGYGHITNISGTNLDDRYVQLSNLDTSLNFASGIASEYDVANKILNVYHDDTCPTYNDESNTLGTNGIASITFDRYGHITEAAPATFLTAETVCDAITGCTIDGGTF